MRQKVSVIIILLSILYSQNNYKTDESNIIPIFMALDGIAIATMWTIDIKKNNLLEDGFLKSEEDGKLFWPHLIAEYGTAVGLVVSAYGLYNNERWAKSSTLLTLGALTYTSVSSMGWSLARKERIIYIAPMLLSLAGAGISISVVF